MITAEVISKVQLIEGEFTPMESLDVINSLIKEKINFHKIHRLSLCEGDENSNTNFDDSRVKELQAEKENFKQIYLEAKQLNKRVKINGIIEIELID
jgi:hypothetical protein